MFSKRRRDIRSAVGLLILLFLTACRVSEVSRGPDKETLVDTSVTTPSNTVFTTPTVKPTQIPVQVPEPVIPEYEPFLPTASGQILRIPTDYETIQEGIIKAAPGDVVLVAPGVYHEQLDFLGKGITVTSEMGPEQTIIDANRNGKGVVFLNGEPLQAVLHGFTVTQGMERLQGETTDSFSFGGGVLILDASPTISHCIIVGNGANYGGGIRIEGRQASPLIKHNEISHNIAAERGGGIQVVDGASPLIQENLIHDNLAMDGAGIEVVSDSSGTIIGNLIADNISGYDFSGEHLDLFLDGDLFLGTMGQGFNIPGGVLIAHRSHPTVRGNLIIDNDGGGIGVFLESSPIIEGNVLRGNRGNLADGILITAGSSPELSGNLIEAGQEAALRLEDTTVVLGLTGNELISSLQEMNTINGEIILQKRSDPGTWVDQVGTVLSVPDDFLSIQEAIDIAKNGDTIQISPGVYRESVDFKGKSLVLTSLDPDDSDLVAETIIESRSGPTVVFQNQEDVDAVLLGLTITNTGNFPAIQISNNAEPSILKNTIRDCGEQSAAVHIQEAGSPRLEGNSIMNNQGSGVMAIYSAPVIVDNLISGNSADIGAGLYTYLADLEVVGNRFENNHSRSSGSGIQTEHFCRGVILGNSFRGNTADFYGAITLDDLTTVTIDSNLISNNLGAGVAVTFDSDSLAVNNLIVNNVGGGFFISSSELKIINNTLVDNTKGGNDASASESWGMFLMEYSKVEVVNTILDRSKIEVYDPYSTVDVSYSLIREPSGMKQEGPGIIQSDPLFKDSDMFHLSSASPCIDAGISVDLAVDYEGDVRPMGGGIDIGADEFYPNPE